MAQVVQAVFADSPEEDLGIGLEGLVVEALDNPLAAEVLFVVLHILVVVLV